MRFGSRVAEYFEVTRGLRQGCVMSSIFSLNDRATGRGVKMRYGNGEEGEIKQVLYADDLMLVAEIREYLQYIIIELEKAG